MMNGKENPRSTHMILGFHGFPCYSGPYLTFSLSVNIMSRWMVQNSTRTWELFGRKLQLFLKLVQGRWRRREGWAENYSRLAHPALSWASVSDQFNLQHPSSPPPPCSLLKPIPSPPHLPPHHNLICNILPPLSLQAPFSNWLLLLLP